MSVAFLFQPKERKEKLIEENGSKHARNAVFQMDSHIIFALL